MAAPLLDKALPNLDIEGERLRHIEPGAGPYDGPVQEEDAKQSRQRGRRAGPSVTREAILTVAREQFSARGYTGTSFRSVATGAGVDPSLLVHYFRTKEGLFSAAFEIIDTLPPQLAQAIRDTGPDRGRRLAHVYLGAYEDPEIGPRLRTVARAASESPAAAGIVRQALEATVLSGLTGLGPQEILRLQCVLGQLFGLAIARHSIGVHGSRNTAMALNHADPTTSDTATFERIDIGDPREDDVQLACPIGEQYAY